MRFALRHTDRLGRTVLTDTNLSRLLDLAQHGDTLHKLQTVPETADSLLEIIEQQLHSNNFTRI